MEHPTKASLRMEARRILAGLSIAARRSGSAEICRRIVALPEWAAAGTVALYAALPSEPDLAPLLNAPGKLFCFPRISGDALEFHGCQSMEFLRPGAWNLLEPDPQVCPIVRASEIDLFLMPGLAFTAAGGRLGRGGGFYDRFLSGVAPRAARVGVCFHAQLVAALPREMHDHTVDLVVTEQPR